MVVRVGSSDVVIRIIASSLLTARMHVAIHPFVGESARGYATTPSCRRLEIKVHSPVAFATEIQSRRT